jgi:hypothetical protein
LSASECLFLLSWLFCIACALLVALWTAHLRKDP